MAVELETRADLMLLLSQAQHALGLRMAAALGEIGLTPRAQCVLTKALPGGQTQSRLAELCALDKTTMVVTVDELEMAGLAERRTSASDRRARIILVTEAGERLVAQGEEIIARVYDEVLAELPEEQRDTLVAALERLVGGSLATPVRCDRPVRRPRPPRQSGSG